MVQSMTAFGAAEGCHGRLRWRWEVRSLNARGLDVKLKLPETVTDLEPALRRQAAAVLDRGSVSAGLRLGRESEASDAAQIDHAALSRQLETVRDLRDRAEAAGVTLGPLSVADALALPGVSAASDMTADLPDAQARAAISGSFDAALAALRQMRAAEGTGLAQFLGDLVTQIDDLRAQAVAMAPERAAHQGRMLTDALARIALAADVVDGDRIAQEVAILAVKGDVSEELDRLALHVAAARTLLARPDAIGRKLDFLTQEFNREANTLCSKSQYGPLTQIGLDLKAAIDQMREQVQNVE